MLNSRKRIIYQTKSFDANSFSKGYRFLFGKKKCFRGCCFLFFVSGILVFVKSGLVVRESMIKGY